MSVLGPTPPSAGHAFAPNGLRQRGRRATRFVSRGIEAWLAEHPEAMPRDESQRAPVLAEPGCERHFDLLIIGSGYGGAMAAHVMAGRRVRDEITGQWRAARIALLERGRERLPGMFPSRFADLAGEVRVQYPTEPDDPMTAVPKPAGSAQGLFDFKLSDAMCALVANGLGGGSLINAGVMLAPRDEIFGNGAWPAALADPAGLRPYFDRARSLVGATMSTGHAPETERQAAEAPNTVAAARRRPAKQSMLGRIGGAEVGVESVPITVQLGDDRREGLKLHACEDCGDCATGCNHDAKRSLDVMLLAQAAGRGVQIYTGVTALRVEALDDDAWAVHATHTDPVLRRRAAAPFVLTAKRLIVAAGSYGSTELLARSQARADVRPLVLSPMLGARFSGNGDMIVAISDLPHPARGVGDPAAAPAARRVGPTITGMLDLRAAEPGVAIQELGIPATLRELLAQTLGLVRMTWAAVDGKRAGQRRSDDDTRIDDATLDRALVLAVMGDDRGEGQLSLPPERGAPLIDVADGAMLMRWKTRPRNAHYQGALDWLRRRCAQDLPNARVHANPIWRPLGRARVMFDQAVEGPRITVHPLGGCPMGDDAGRGVVDHLGRVFDPAGGDGALHQGLAVLDGAILPGAVGINPALTISAVALRAAEALAADWGLVQASGDDATSARWQGYRPVFADAGAERAPPPRRPTMLALSERLVGRAVLAHGIEEDEVVIELTLHSAPFDARATLPAGARILLQGRAGDLPPRADRDAPATVPDVSRLRIFRLADWMAFHDPEASLAWRKRDPANWPWMIKALQAQPDVVLDGIALLSASVSGTIDVLHERPAPRVVRLMRGGWAWARNTGARTLWQMASDRLGRRGAPAAGATLATPTAASTPAPAASNVVLRFLRERMPVLLSALAHAGRRRDMIYSLVVHTPDVVAEPWLRVFGNGEVRIEGRKRVRYQPHQNTWRQLMQVHLERFPLLERAQPLTLDLGWLAGERSPLLRIVDENSGPEGWADYAHFVGEVGRPVLLQSLFAFVAPDRAREKVPDELRHGTTDPAAEAAPLRTVAESVHDATDDASTVRPAGVAGTNAHRLARAYDDLHCECFGNGSPAHPDKPYRLMRIRDPHAIGRHQSAAALPPVLLIHGYSASGTTWAHPMLAPGLARCLAARGRDVWVIDMRSSCGLDTATHPWTFEDIAHGDLPDAMALIRLLSGRDPIDVVAHCMGAVMFSMTMLAAARHSVDAAAAGLQARVRRIVLSQAGPVMRFSKMNVFRAYLMQAVRYLLPNNRFQFRPVEPGALGEEVLDRLLSTLPYPDDSEFALENPLFARTPYTQVRHRMDILYGKAFTLANLPAGVLDSIDDFFGPLSTDTIAQSIGFARHERIADAHGRPYPLEDRLAEQWRAKTLWVHGAQNGIFEPSSVLLAHALFDRCGIGERLSSRVFAGLGHQDSLIGRNCRPVLDAIGDFLETP